MTLKGHPTFLEAVVRGDGTLRSSGMNRLRNEFISYPKYSMLTAVPPTSESARDCENVLRVFKEAPANGSN